MSTPRMRAPCAAALLLALALCLSLPSVLAFSLNSEGEDTVLADVSAEVFAGTALTASAYAIPGHLRARHAGSDTLEYSLRDGMLTVLAQSRSSKISSELLQMPDDVTAGQLLRSDFPQRVLQRSLLQAKTQAGRPLCAMRTADAAVAADTQLSSLLSAPSPLHLECALSGSTLGHKAVFRFQSFAQAFPSIVADDAAMKATMDKILMQMPEKEKEYEAKKAANPNYEAEQASMRARKQKAEASLMEMKHTQEARTATELATPAVAALYPTQSVDFSSELQWVAETWEAMQMFGNIRTYPTWQSRGLTGRYDGATGTMLRAGQKPAASRTPLRLSLTADWASGTVEADYVQQLMMKGRGVAPDWTLNAGDIYWNGTPENVKNTCLGVPAKTGGRGVRWPTGRVGSLFVLGNHEMYNRGDAFFDLLMPTLGSRSVKQHAGYASIETADWRVLMLDTGFGSYKKWGTNQPPSNSDMPAQLYTWLERDLKLSDPADKRGILIITHHQPNTAFEVAYELPAAGLADRLPNGRRVVWLYGHEHKLAFYDVSTVRGKSGNSFSYFGRCVGNGGFPTNLVPNAGPVAPPNSGRLLGYDSRVYQTLNKKVDPDKKNDDGGVKKSFNGWVELTLNGRQLDISYRTLKLVSGYATNSASDEFARESFTVDAATGNVNHVANAALKFNYRHSPVLTRNVLLEGSVQVEPESNDF